MRSNRQARPYQPLIGSPCTHKGRNPINRHFDSGLQPAHVSTALRRRARSTAAGPIAGDRPRRCPGRALPGAGAGSANETGACASVSSVER
jgi:hypothetical protein